MLVIKTGHFSINPFDPAFWYTFAVATAITSAILAAGVIVGAMGAKDAPTTDQGRSVADYLKQIPDWWQTLPSAAVTAWAVGLTIGGLSYDLTPTMTYRTFNVQTVQLNAALAAQGIGTDAQGSHIYYQTPKPNTNDPYIVTVVHNNGAESSGMVFKVDKNGYIIPGPEASEKCKQDPSACYLPFFKPTVDSSGKIAGVTKNIGAFNAIMQIPACAAIANDMSLKPADREAAWETCSRNNKDTQYIPLFN